MAKPLVIITGSSGLIGYALCERLARDFTVVGLDRKGPPHPPPSADCVEFDIASDESVGRALETVRARHGGRVASVVHLAAYYDFAGGDSPLYDEITVKGTERLWNALTPFEVEQFNFSSTMLVHAPVEPGKKIIETSPLEPAWAYPVSKVEVEDFLLKNRGETPVVLARIAGVYDDYGHSIPVANQIQRIHERRLTGLVFPGDVNRGQSFIHLEDLVDALELTIKRRAALPPALPLLLGEPESPSYDRLQKAIARALYGQTWETKRIPKFFAKMGAWLQEKAPFMGEPFIKPWMIDFADQHYALDIQKAQDLLGWRPRHRLLETIPKMVEALKADPEGWYKENGLAKAHAAEREPATYPS